MFLLPNDRVQQAGPHNNFTSNASKRQYTITAQPNFEKLIVMCWVLWLRSEQSCVHYKEIWKNLCRRCFATQIAAKWQLKIRSKQPPFFFVSIRYVKTSSADHRRWKDRSLATRYVQVTAILFGNIDNKSMHWVPNDIINECAFWIRMSASYCCSRCYLVQHLTFPNVLATMD